MPPKTKHLKLPFQFDSKKLKVEVDSLLNQTWKPHFNQNGYTGNWKSIALYAIDGKHDYIFVNPDQNSTEVKPTDLLTDCPYLKEVIAHIQAPFIAVRLLNLESGAHIKPHQDHESGYENNFMRIHVPIATNPSVQFILDNEKVEMLPGECWYTNVNFVHEVKNEGTEDRIHLVIDAERNTWSDNLFYTLAPKESFVDNQTETHSKEEILTMIDNLKRLPDPGAKELIKTLQKQLDNL